MPKSGNPRGSALWGTLCFFRSCSDSDVLCVSREVASPLWASVSSSVNLWGGGSRRWGVRWHSSGLCGQRDLAGNCPEWVSEFSRTFATSLRTPWRERLGKYYLSPCWMFANISDAFLPREFSGAPKNTTLGNIVLHPPLPQRLCSLPSSLEQLNNRRPSQSISCDHWCLNIVTF